MDIYNLDGKCIKCGSGDIKDRHIEGGPDTQKSEIWHLSYILRICKNCKFAWDETPLDTPSQDESEPTSFQANDINPPEIKMGDEVHGRCDHTTCKVIGIDPVEKICAIQCTEMSWCVCDSNDANNDTPLHLKDLTLIRKGPEVIERVLEIKPIVSDMVLHGGPFLSPGRYDAILMPIKDSKG